MLTAKRNGWRTAGGLAAAVLALGVPAVFAAAFLPALSAQAAEHGDKLMFSGITGLWVYLAVFGALVLCGLGMPVPEDIILISGGFLASQTGEPAWPGSVPMVATGMLGILVGDSIIYWAGRHFGMSLAQGTLLRRVLTPERLEKTRVLFHGHGEKIIMAARFMPGVRAVVFFSSGATHVPYWKFVAFDGLAAMVSAPLWVILGYVALHAALQGAKDFKYVLGALVVLGIVAWVVWRWVSARRAARARAGAEIARLPPREVGEERRSGTDP